MLILHAFQLASQHATSEVSPLHSCLAPADSTPSRPEPLSVNNSTDSLSAEEL